VPGQRPWRYCLTPGDGAARDSLVYYFHGGNGDEYGWIDPTGYGETLRKIWKARGQGSPTVVAVSFGPLWLLTEKNSRPLSGLMGVMNDEILPYVEKNLLEKPPKERILLGESMGGFNAAVLGLREPRKFSKLALVCPGVGIGADGTSDVESYVRVTGASPWYARRLFSLGEMFFDSREAVARQSPLEILRKMDAKANPNLRVFLSCGRDDEYGFFKSSRNFAETAEKRGLRATWRPVDGGHCSLDSEALAGFLNNH
jgi:pimeloyl-ACP methyl ester carboxylesterase